MDNTLVILGFPGIGKTYLHKHFGDNATILDSDSSNFSWLRNADGSIATDANGAKIRHPNFSQNYMDHIKENLGRVDVLCGPTHASAREACNDAGIPHVIVYPAYELKEEYLQRYIDRGSPESFVDLIRKNWDNFINGIKNDACPNKVELKSGQYLADVLDNIAKMMSKVRK